MINTNIRYARMASGLSLQELSEKLTKSGYNTTKATLSNYENGKYEPSLDFLKVLSQELNTPLGFLQAENTLDQKIEFFSVPDMVDRKRQNLEAFISVELSRFQYIDNILGLKAEWRPREKMKVNVSDTSAIEKVAEAFRDEYGAGSAAIATVCGLLEQKGWHIFSLPDFCSSDLAICGYDSTSGVPFILYKPDGYQDEMRLSLLTNIGYSLLEGETKEETEEIARKFAIAVLLPEALAKYTYGKKRTVITETELSTGKRLYGIGKKYIIRRLYDLDIIPQGIYKEFYLHITQKHDLARSSGLIDDSNFFDMPTTYEMRVIRANVEGLAKVENTKTIYTGKDY